MKLLKKQDQQPINTSSNRPKRHYFPRKRLWQIQRSLFLVLSFFALFFYLTNPFTRFSVVQDPFQILNDGGDLISEPRGRLYLLDNEFARSLGEFKSAWHILTNRFSGGGKGSKHTSLEGIIDDIHTLRFNPKLPFLISGDHFSMLYPRSLGIFYHSTLDPRTARTTTDWLNRQTIYLKTTNYALETYRNAHELSTTIIPLGPQSVTIGNYFSPPSDTLYSLLYALDTLQSTDELTSRYRYNSLDTKQYQLETAKSAQESLLYYQDSLKRHYQEYVSMVTDPETGLVRKNIVLSSTKDSVVRSSSFYDNVILWKTHQLAQKLALTPADPTMLATLKQKILQAFWLPQDGYFLEELSPQAIKEKHYSSDWLIAYLTGFLDPQNPAEREYFMRSVDYIKKQSLDRPFGLKYEPTNQPDNIHFIVKLFASRYGTKAIWSNWGMEYTKLLTALYQVTCNPRYLNESHYQINAYSHNIVTFHGYPEVYDTNGKPFKTPLYAEVHQTGWVVSFEEARAMYQYTVNQKATFCPTEKTE